MEPFLIDVPETIPTPRLVLRTPRPGDGTEVNAAIVETFEELHKWIPWAGTLQTTEETEVYLRKAKSKWIQREHLQYLITDKENGNFIGAAGLFRINWEARGFEAGYWIRKSATGRGYVLEATNALTLFAFNEMQANRVELRIDPQNERSVNVAKKLGFDYEGCLRKNYALEGRSGIRDTAIYARLNTTGLPPV